MRRLVALLVMFFCFSYAAAGIVLQKAEGNSLVIEARVEKWSVKEGKLDLGDGRSSLGALIAVPGPEKPDVRVEVLESTPCDGVKSTSSQLVELSQSMRFRDYLVRVLRFSPVRTTSKGSEIVKRARISITFPKAFERKTHPSLSFLPLYKSVILNFDQASPPVSSYRRGGMLIITHDDFYDEILPLAEWKNEKGFKTDVVKLSDIGANPTAADIKSFIESYYQSHNPRPDFVVLVGNKDYVPAFYFGINITDHPYSLVDGDDYIPDIFVGRLPARSPQEAQVIVDKIIGYEKNPYTEEPSWFKRALMCAGVYTRNFELVNSTKHTKLWAKEQLENFGYEVDTVFGYEWGGPGSTEDIVYSINQGVSIVNYRGWSNTSGWIYPGFLTQNIQSLENGWKLPVMFSLTCGTGNFASSPCFGEVWILAGYPGNPKGGPAFFGPSELHTHTRWNNAIDVGIFRGLLYEGDKIYSQACTRGLLELLTQFPDRTSPADSSGCIFYFYIYNILGDPSLDIWTDIPIEATADLPSAIPVGQSLFRVQLNSGRGPIEGAYVNLIKEGEIYIGGLTDAAGQFAVPLNITSPGTLKVVISGANIIPIIQELPVVSQGLFVGYNSHSIDDSQGNGDGLPNPGEVISLYVSLKNYGSSQTATSVSAVLRSTDTLVTVLDSVVSYGDIAPGATADPSTPFQIALSPRIPGSPNIKFELEVYAGDSVFTSGFEIHVTGTSFRLEAVQVNDAGGDGYIDPGETADITFTINNTGETDAVDLVGYLLHGYEGVIFSDSTASFGTVPAGGTASNSSPFVISLHPDVTPGRIIKLYLKLVAATGETRTFPVFLEVSQPSISYPSGPDSYGYWAYDSYDTEFTEAPEFEWIELDPDYGGSGTPLDLGNDGLAVLSLPFTFTYYGNNFNYITVCTNGWAAFDSTDQFAPRNWKIPSPFGPDNLIALFWDDLDSIPGGVFYKYDSENHRFIIEWSRLYNRFDGISTETFELILLDPAYYSTVTGDGELIFQYLEVNNVDSVHYYTTVGIENEDHTMGLQYVYGTEYARNAAPLENGLAIKFTTDPPDTFVTGVKHREIERLSRAFISVRPNVTKDRVTLLYSLGNLNKGKLQVYNATGRLVRELELSGRGGSVKIDLRGLGSGVYFLRLKAGKEIAKERMVILR